VQWPVCLKPFGIEFFSQVENLISVEENGFVHLLHEIFEFVTSVQSHPAEKVDPINNFLDVVGRGFEIFALYLVDLSPCFSSQFRKEVNVVWLLKLSHQVVDINLLVDKSYELVCRL
jgi:hypothetical protein